MPMFFSTASGTVCHISAADVPTVVQEIVPLLQGTRNAIYFDGWDGLGASAVLRAIAEHPPPSLKEKFDKIIHIDCSRWKSRRELQRAIADELKLTQQVAAIFDVQDEEDDFNSVDQGSRAEIRGVTTLIARSLAQYRCLAIFHHGGDDLVDLTSCGIPQPEVFDSKILWTFRGRLRVDTGILKKVEIPSQLPVRANTAKLNELLAEEARDIALYTHKLGLGVTPEVATDCCLYLLSLNDRGDDIIDYNWATHASNYWVCDGIVQGGQEHQAWEIARALQQQIRLEEYSSMTNRVPRFGSKLDISTKHWVSPVSSDSKKALPGTSLFFPPPFGRELVSSILPEPTNSGDNLDISEENWISTTSPYFKEVPPRTTSLFFAPRSGHASLPTEPFQTAAQLRVLKLCRCTFSFSSPPFYCCRNLRFLGLDRCKDEQQGEEKEKRGARAVEIFQGLWVLDVSHTDWELPLPVETETPVVSTDIREIHIKEGRIWRSNFAWRRLPNLRRLRVVEPTSPWETAGREDEFMDMIKLELLDLSGNSTIQVLPSLSDAANMKTLVLDGCVELEHVGPQGLPPSLESFCFDSGLGEDDESKAKISHINLAGCARLADFKLHGSLPNLVELDLSHTAVKTLDLKDKATVQCLQKVFLVGCELLRSISWPYEKWNPLRLLCVDTRSGGEVARNPSWFDAGYLHAFVAVTDMRLLQSFWFLWNWKWYVPEVKAKMNLCWSSSSKDDGSARTISAGSPLPRSLTYNDVSTQHKIATQIDGSSSATTPFQPLDIHMEIGEGVSDVPNTARPGNICYAMDKVKSLHVHDSSSITAVTHEHIVASSDNRWGVLNALKQCRVERCPRLQTVFTTQYEGISFRKLEKIWAAHLLMARSIWRSSPRQTMSEKGWQSFEALRTIHLQFCPRLRYVLQVSWNDNLSQLEILHIHFCGDLRQVFAVEQEVLERIAASHEYAWQKWKSRKGMLEFPKLKYLYLHELPSLQQICEAKMYAPNLETIHIRGCWGLRRLPATDSRRHEDGHPVAVDCEKDWWDKLEWDGMESGHHPSLFEPYHSKYYRKRHLRSTVLR